MLALKIPTQVVYTADQSAEHAGRGWVSGLFVRRWGLLSILRVIYILWSHVLILFSLDEGIHLGGLIKPIFFTILYYTAIEFFFYYTILQLKFSFDELTEKRDFFSFLYFIIKLLSSEVKILMKCRQKQTFTNSHLARL